MWQYNYTNPDNELYHYGVAGMKWGVRHEQRVMSRQAKKIARRNDETRFFGGIAGASASLIARKKAQEARAKYEEAYNATYNKALKDLQKQSSIGKSQIDKVMTKRKRNKS